MRQDDPALAGDIMVYRRIPPKADHVTWDENGNPTPSRQNFRDKDDELSVHIANETTPDEMLKGHDGYGLVYLTVQHFRDVYSEYKKPLIVCRDTEEPENGHILICGKPTPGMKSKFQSLAQWVAGRWPRREQEPA